MHSKIFYICFLLNFMCDVDCLLNNEIEKQQFLQFLRPCHLSDPHFIFCVRQNINKLRPFLNHGIPELRIPGCDPFHLPDIVLDEGTKAINISGRGTDLKLYGATNFNLDTLAYDIQSLQLNFQLSFSHLKAEGSYVVDGEIMQIPIFGAGEVFIHFYNVSATVAAQGTIQNKNNIDYLLIKDLNLDFNLGHVTVDIKGLFGNKKKEVADSIVHFINKNWKMIAEEVIPLFKQGFMDHLKNTLNSILENYSIREWLPE